MTPEDKLQSLRRILAELGCVAVAYSGGVDSAFLLKVAHDELGERAIALTAVSPSLPKIEQQAAQDIARWIGARQVEIDTFETQDPYYLENAPDRCFFCKSEVYSRLFEYAQREGYAHIIDGTNADDAGDHRPGRQAARKHGVRSPLLEAGLTKDEIRGLSRQLGLPIWDKPAAACLSSRIPYGTRISLEILSQVEQAELTLRRLGFQQLRVRHHNETARIEVPAEQLGSLLERRLEILQALKELGYTYVTLDLEGFRSGSMNEALLKRGRG